MERKTDDIMEQGGGAFHETMEVTAPSALPGGYEVSGWSQGQRFRVRVVRAIGVGERLLLASICQNI